MNDRSPYEEQIDRNSRESSNIISGMSASTLPIGGVALGSIPIMAIFGEGDYIIAALAIAYAALFFFGLRIRRYAGKRSARRVYGWWSAFYSAVLAIGLSTLAVTLALEPGGWRYIG